MKQDTNGTNKKLRGAAPQSVKHSPDEWNSSQAKKTVFESNKNFANIQSQKYDKRREMLSLMVCAIGICFCYLSYGVIHEHLSTSDFIKASGPLTSFILFTQSITNSVVAWVWKSVQTRLFQQTSPNENSAGKGLTGKLNQRLMFLAALCYSGAMSATNESLNHVSYPTATLAKSSKLIPTMMMGILIEKKSYSRKEWVGVMLITIGIITFNFSRMNSNTSNTKSDSPFGLALLSLSLVMDGLLGSCQSMLKKPNSSSQKDKTQYRPPSAIETMLYINLYSILFILPSALFSGHLKNAMNILFPTHRTPEAFTASRTASQYIIMLNACAALGQIFIFFTINLFSPLMCTTITTTRKFFTILLSVTRFGHVFTIIQWISVLMVFGGIYLEIMSKFDHKKPGSHEQKDVSNKKTQ